ncbi:hypothetical protein IE53DRAFT_45606 [Violaceomyces palustris]|uniref:Uncharacterized protein n=1 Tax=Violaceomyces palustris TaxID=1673888 RepID=A0ACD0P0I7_9BASI|nr:hypothetical protein IE53DRAFT_45606 [Violaceomyces palustris]
MVLISSYDSPNVPGSIPGARKLPYFLFFFIISSLSLYFKKRRGLHPCCIKTRLLIVLLENDRKKEEKKTFFARKRLCISSMGHAMCSQLRTGSKRRGTMINGL